MLEILSAGRGVEPWAPSGDVSGVPLDGQEILAAVEHDREEVERRSRYGLVAVPHRRALQLLLSIPLGVDVPLSLFRSADRRLLVAMPPGAVVLDRDNVSASLRPALSLLSVGVVASTWKQGLRATSRFASYCERYVVLRQRRRLMDLAVAAVEARYFGVGLALHHDEELEWLVSPEPFHPDRFTAASWLMAERITEARHRSTATNH